MEGFELAVLYDRQSEESRERARRMVNDGVRAVMEQVAAVWEHLAHRTLVRHALQMAADKAEKPNDTQARPPICPNDRTASAPTP